MFTIDLLKGKNVPAGGRPEGLVLTAVTIAVPLIAAIAMLGCAAHNKVTATIQKQNILNYKLKTREYAGAVEARANLDQEKNGIHNCMSEVAEAIRQHNQWSPVLVCLVENLPSQMVLTELSAKQRSMRMKVPKLDEPEKTVEASVPVTTLQMSVAGSPHTNQDEEIRHFRNAIRACPALDAKLQDIRVSQGSDTLNSQHVVTYVIDCVLKPQL